MATSETDSSDGGDNPALGLNWQVSRWGREDQRGNGNLMNATKVLEASRLIKTGEIVSLGRPYEAGMPLAGMALGAPLAHLAGSPHMASTPYLAGSPYEAYRTRLTDQTHLADTFDLSFAGRYIFPIVIPVVLGGLGVLMLDEAMNDDDDDDDEAGKARALVAASGLAIIGLGLGISLDELVVGFTISFTSTLPIADVITAIAIVIALGALVVSEMVQRFAQRRLTQFE